MDQYLTDSDARVLGALIEKQVTTPDNYPLSLNALILACNQSSNRHPVVSYDEETVLAAMQRLRRASLVRGIQRIDARVTKYEHMANDTLDVDEKELAVLCVLLLRGPNTIGELRTRTERLARFESLPDVEATLDALSDRERDPLVMRLPRRAGQKEVRYAHLLSGPVPDSGGEMADAVGAAHVVVAERTVVRGAAAQQDSGPASDDRVAALEVEVAALKNEMSDLRQQLEAFRQQFE